MQSRLKLTRGPVHCLLLFHIGMPAVAHRPTRICSNFPICAHRVSRDSNSDSRQYSDFCPSCASRASCPWLNCSSPQCLQSTDSLPYCATHLGLSRSQRSLVQMHNSSQNHSVLQWPSCGNASSRGCLRLSTSKAGGLCLACSSGHLP